jgi:hypothetical protein
MFAIARLSRQEGGLLSLKFQVGGEFLDEEKFNERYKVLDLGTLTPWHTSQDPVQGGSKGVLQHVTEAVGLVLIEPWPEGKLTF